MKPSHLVVPAALVLWLTACGGGDSPAAVETSTSGVSTQEGSSSPPSESAAGADQNADSLAAELKDEVGTVTKAVTITEDNDPNDLLGRPNGYVSAAVLYDSAAACGSLGSDCGTVIEVFKDEAAATARAEYIQGILAGSPALGSEWDYVNGAALLRVSGELKPSAAAAYAEAFGGTEVTAGE